MQELIGNALDFRRHGCREKQRLPGDRQQFGNAFDVRNKAHVEHPVSFIDHENLDVREHQLAAFDMIQQAARGRDDNVSAAVDLAVLLFERHAAHQQRNIELVVLAEQFECFMYLGSQFPGRFQNKRARHAGPCAALFENVQHRQRKRGRFARACLGQAQDILALKGRRNGFCLDFRRFSKTGVLDGG